MQDTTGLGPPADARPTDFLLDCPEEVRPILYTFTAEQVHNEYPLLHSYKNPHDRDYLSVSVFLHRYPGYRFAWVIENDVRYTGPSWGAYFNSMLNIAVAAMNGSPYEAYSDELAVAPGLDTKLPDFVDFRESIVPHVRPVDWYGTKNPKLIRPHDADDFYFKNYIRTWAMAFGMSRRYIDHLHAHSIRGNGGYIEEVLMSLAIEEKLDIVSIPIATWNVRFTEADKYHGLDWYTHGGMRYYENWFTGGQCRYFHMIHPMKSRNETVWGRLAKKFD